MSDRLEWFNVTVPAFTPKATPLVSPLVFQQGEVTEINIKILDGPCGTVGFFLMCGGTQYIPRTPGSFVIPNDDYLVWPVTNAGNHGSWGMTSYNTDTWPHLIQVGFHVLEDTNPAVTIAASTGATVNSVTASLGQIEPLPAEPGDLSLDALLNSTPLGSTVTSNVAPTDLAALFVPEVTSGPP